MSQLINFSPKIIWKPISFLIIYKAITTRGIGNVQALVQEKSKLVSIVIANDGAHTLIDDKIEKVFIYIQFTFCIQGVYGYMKSRCNSIHATCFFLNPLKTFCEICKISFRKAFFCRTPPNDRFYFSSDTNVSYKQMFWKTHKKLLIYTVKCDKN